MHFKAKRSFLELQRQNRSSASVIWQQCQRHTVTVPVSNGNSAIVIWQQCKCHKAHHKTKNVFVRDILTLNFKQKGSKKGRESHLSAKTISSIKKFENFVRKFTPSSVQSDWLVFQLLFDVVALWLLNAPAVF